MMNNIYKFNSIEELFQYSMGYACEIPDKFEIEDMEEEFELVLYGKYRGVYYRVFENEYLESNIVIKYASSHYELLEFSYIDELENKKEYFGKVEVYIDSICEEIERLGVKITKYK